MNNQNLREGSVMDSNNQAFSSSSLAETNLAQSYGYGGEQNLAVESVTSTSAWNMASTSMGNLQVPANSTPTFRSISLSGLTRDMEDALHLEMELDHPRITGNNPLHFFSVFEGHGGTQIAELCKSNIHLFLSQELINDGEEHKGAAPSAERWTSLLNKTFERADEAALELCARGSGSDRMGSTAVITLVAHYQIIVANCGDSRVVLSRGGEAIPLSFDHKPDRPDELERIQANEERVIYLNGAKLMGQSALSRSLGDKYLKPHIISKPEVTFTPRMGEDEFIILASRGLWDAVSINQACEVVRICLFGGHAAAGNEEQINQSRCNAALRMLTTTAYTQGCRTNITITVVKLRQ